jgi:ABC-type Fe3+-siderophore transport system permease subunit
MFFVTLGFGVYDISLGDALDTFFAHLSGNVTDARDDRYVWDIRTPRALAAIICGAALSVAGAVMQNDFRNPLAEPYSMGLSSGAFLGAVVSIVSGISVIPFLDGSAATMANAFLFSLIPTAIIVAVSAFKKLTPTAMVLTGIAVMFMFNSVSQMIMVSAPSETLADAYAWRVGDLGKVSWDEIPMMAGASILIIALLWMLSGKLNVMYAGDRPAQSLGESANRIRLVTLVLVSFLTASVVCFTGTIGFIGLVGPHIARIFVGSDNRYLIPASAAFGGAFLLFADTIAKVSGANGLPVGVISAIIGAPLFIWILIRQRKSAWL